MQNVSSKEIAEELGITSRHVLRQIWKRADQLRIKIILGKRNKIFLSRADADTLISDYKPRRRSHTSLSVDAATSDGFGYVYIIQLHPNELPLRHKLGYTDNLEVRLADHRTAAPTLRLVKAWRSQRTWEAAAIASITRGDCNKISAEVYDGDTNGFVKRAEAFFSLMPQPAVCDAT